MNAMTVRSSVRTALPVVLEIAALISLPHSALAGGPLYVAGASYFDSDVKGTPVTWAHGTLNYYTDQGDLSTQLPGPSADAFVADAFSRWTSISTAAISASAAGQLGEDVSGANVTANGDGTISMPEDILPAATGEPVGVVYDADGAVTDALLGTGASNTSDCFSNAVFGGPDNLSTDGYIVHALVILNGNCAQTEAQLPDLKYRLVRLLGRVLGLNWSQANLNVITGSPVPSAADYAGFPLMHAVDPVYCAPIVSCYPSPIDPAQPKPDDQAALSRLYPVTAENQASFPGKQLFSVNTVRIHGSVYFADPSGQPAQPMQGVNVVARWVDPATGLPSRAYVVTSVSGFLFRGNAGNLVTGFTDATGQRYARFGSDDTTVEGFFDLAGLQIPDGTGVGEFELSVEPVDPTWSKGMGPYGTAQVQPSGATRVFVYANTGQDVQQDLLMQGSAAEVPNWFGPTSFASPAAVPAAGDWSGSLSPYGDADYFQLAAQANRTISVAVTALDEAGAPSESKAQPVIGMWTLADTGSIPAPANTPSAFNTLVNGESRLDAQLNATTGFRIGIADLRGDGRPDFRYHAHVFYGDTIAPVRASVAGGTPLAIQGLGFGSGTAATIASTSTPLLAFSANQLLVTAPPLADGVKNVLLSDPATGGASTMFGVLTYGAGPSDIIKLITGSNPQTPVGAQAENPVVVQVLTPDGVTPVAGASVFFTSSPSVAFSACGGAASCTVLTDESGYASSYLTVLNLGAATITAELAPASYSPPKTVQATVNGTPTSASGMDVALAPQQAWIAEGAAVSLPVTARALANGAPLSGKTITFRVEKGSGVLSLSSVATDTDGYATTALELGDASGDVELSACSILTSGSTPSCANFQAVTVPASGQFLQAVAGSLQIAPVGQDFQPVTVRVTDSLGDPVLGANLAFQWLVARAPQNLPVVWIGDTGISAHPLPVILSSLQAMVQSDVNGLATVQPSTGGVQGAVVVLGSVSTGAGSLQFELQSLPPLGVAPSTQTSSLRGDPGAQ
jgi:IPT/TIG domain